MMGGFNSSDSKKLAQRVVEGNVEIQFTSAVQICQVTGTCMCGYVCDYVGGGG